MIFVLKMIVDRKTEDNKITDISTGCEDYLIDM